MKLVASLWLFAAICLLPVTAFAQSPGGGRDFSARLETGFGAWTSRSDDTNVTQYRFTLGPEFNYRNIVYFTPMLRMTSTSIDLRADDSRPFDAGLSLPWYPSLGLRLGVNAFRYRWFRLGLRGEVEFPLGENRAYLNSFTPRGEISDVEVDIDTLRNHVQVGHLWTQASAALTLGADVGWWHPYVDLGFTHVSSRLSVNFDSEATRLLSDVDVNPRRYYNSGDSTFFYIVGSEFDLGRGFGLRVTTTLLPTSDRLFFMGEGALLVPFDFGLGGGR